MLHSQVVMEFTSSELGVVESFTTLRLSQHGISVPFLLVGDTRDTNISLDRSHLNFKTILIGEIKTILIGGNSNHPHWWDLKPSFLVRTKTHPHWIQPFSLVSGKKTTIGEVKSFREVILKMSAQ